MGCLRVNLTNRLQHEHLGKAFCIDPRRVVIGIEPADSGKTTDLYTACAGWAAAARRVILLATSEASARKRLVGDSYQLGAVEGGGAFPLIVDDVEAVELTGVHRSTNPAESAATLLIRNGSSMAPTKVG